MKQNHSFQMLKHFLIRNKVQIIILILAIAMGLTIGGYAEVQA